MKQETLSWIQVVKKQNGCKLPRLRGSFFV